MSRYETVQHGWIWILLPVIAVVVLGVSFAQPDADQRAIVLAMALVLLVLSAAVAHLRIRDEGTSLSIRWGPLPLFRKRIDYAKLTDVELVRAPVWLGWGLRWWPGKGWAWVIHGRDLVRLHMGSRSFHVGSPEPERLVGLLRERMAER